MLSYRIATVTSHARRVDRKLLALLLILVTAAAWLAHVLSSTPLVGYDDANIFFVYARNIAAGHGFVYYPGGERVEGFTSPAWVIVCAAIMNFTARPEPILAATNIALIAAAAYALATYLRDFCIRFGEAGRLESESIALLLTTTLALAPGFIVWTTVSLMDFGLWTANLLLCAICVLRIFISDEQARRQWRRGFLVMITLLALVRPEAMLWGPILLSLAVSAEWSTGQTIAQSVKVYAAHAASFAAASLGLVIFRSAYFGYPLPNTYYAKTSGTTADRVREGASYFADFVFSNPAFLLALALALLTLALRRAAATETTPPRQLVASQLCVLAMLVVSAVIPIVEGGDHFGFWRMYQPAWPLVAVQAVHSGVLLFRPPRALRDRALFYVAGALVAAIALVRWTDLPRLSYPSRFAPAGEWNTPRLEIAIAQDMREIGSAFNTAFPTHRPSVGVIVAGGFALTYEGPVIDLMGLNNVAMAHSPGPRVGFRNHAAFHPDVFFQLAPDIVLLSLWSSQRPDWFGFPMMSGVFDHLPESTADYWSRRAVSMAAFDGAILKGLLRQPRMADGYAWASVRPSAGGRWVHAIFSRTCLTRLKELGYEISFPVRKT